MFVNCLFVFPFQLKITMLFLLFWFSCPLFFVPAIELTSICIYLIFSLVFIFSPCLLQGDQSGFRDFSSTTRSVKSFYEAYVTSLFYQPSSFMRVWNRVHDLWSYSIYCTSNADRVYDFYENGNFIRLLKYPNSN